MITDSSLSFSLPAIFAATTKLGLDPFLVQGLIWVESRGKCDAFRHEPLFWQRYLVRQDEYKTQDPRRVSSSYGLMQIMYPTARELGFLGEPEELFIPRVNLQWGCQKLLQLQAWADQHATPTVTKDDRRLAMLAAYNGGTGGNTPGYPLRPDNRQYAERVLAAYRTIRDEHSADTQGTRV